MSCNTQPQIKSGRSLEGGCTGWARELRCGHLQNARHHSQGPFHVIPNPREEQWVHKEGITERTITTKRHPCCQGPPLLISDANMSQVETRWTSKCTYWLFSFRICLTVSCFTLYVSLCLSTTLMSASLLRFVRSPRRCGRGVRATKRTREAGVATRNLRIADTRRSVGKAPCAMHWSCGHFQVRGLSVRSKGGNLSAGWCPSGQSPNTRDFSRERHSTVQQVQAKSSKRGRRALLIIS